MHKLNIYANEWLAVHPYASHLPSDRFFVELANRLYAVTAAALNDVPQFFRKKICIYGAAYLEDVISGLGLWKAFTAKNTELYGAPVPFYPTDEDYIPDEINLIDVQFIVWNTLQKAFYAHPYVDPTSKAVLDAAAAIYSCLDEVYETAPENETLDNYMKSFIDEPEARHKLEWLFGHTYLTEPSVQNYKIAPEDIYDFPCGPSAMNLHEWIVHLKGGPKWMDIIELFPYTAALPEAQLASNKRNYELFTAYTKGSNVLYLKGYDALRNFLTQVLLWPDNENHTLPGMKKHKDFVLMIHPQKGLLIAKDICAYIHDPANPYYLPHEAAEHAFSILTQESVCPPDLLHYLIREHYLPDAQLPGSTGQPRWIACNQDFIARHALGFYYNAD